MSYLSEKEHLEKTLSVIDKMIEEEADSFDEASKEMRRLTKIHWDEHYGMDDGAKSFSESEIKKQSDIARSRLVRCRSLLEARKKPYFGKITVAYDEGDIDDHYIGIATIDNGNDMYAVDWRCPIGSLFYNSKLGKTYYKVNDNEIECELVNRKQIKIKDSKLLRIVDTDVHLDDDELQEVLSKSSGEHMKNIISTIQEEQNEVIRNVKDKSIIVEGCAGSGKTSVALHRLAYLLYHDHNSTSNNMLVFSPNDVFSGYISNVLPELGEENIMETTFKDFAESFIKGFQHIESYTEFVSRYYNYENTELKDHLTKVKFSEEYKQALKNFAIKKSGTYRFTDDFEVNGCTVLKDYLNKLLESDSFQGYPLYERIERISDVIFGKLPVKDRFTKQTLNRRLTDALVKYFNVKKIYNEFLNSEEFKNISGSTDMIEGNKYLEYPDAIGMLYLNFEMMGYPVKDKIHHVVIDEAQDYIPLQLEMIRKIFMGSTFTILGDSLQTINPYFKYDSLEDMKKVIGAAKYLRLDKAYRSSPEIMDYASKITGANINVIRKSDNVPVKIKDVSKEEVFTELVKDILTLKENGYERICIITKDAKEATAIHEGLSDKVDNITVISDNEDSIKSTTTISPAYISKGLEFDAVICYNDLENSFSEKDKYLYYVGVTRAQHALTIYNEPQKIMKKGVK